MRLAASFVLGLIVIACGPPRAAGDVEPHDASGLAFVFIPRGTFDADCVINSPGCSLQGKRPENLPGFWIGKTEVTVAAWRRCMSAGRCPTFPPPVEDFPKEDSNFHMGLEDHPINGVNHELATTFCRWVGGALPTAMQWEHAATGGLERVYPWGDEPPDGTRANFCEQRCREATDEINIEHFRGRNQRAQFDDAHDDGFASTAPVGRFPAGATVHGVLDMGGNVYEWMQDDALTPGMKLTKGGSWRSEPRLLSPAVSIQSNPNSEGDLVKSTIGFRCVRKG